MLDLFRKRLPPATLRIFCAIPVEKEAFMRLCTSGSSDFIATLRRGRDISCVDLWHEYSRDAGYTAEVLAKAADRGAEVLSGTDFASLGDLPPCRTLVIIAHRATGHTGIEISGRVIDESEFIRRFPLNVTECVDLTSCHSAVMLTRLKTRNPRCRFIGIESATTLRLRIHMLDRAVDRMCRKTIVSYETAFSLIAHNMLGMLGMFQTYCGADDMPEPCTAPAMPSPGVRLGEEAPRSSVYAPARVARGTDFLVQLFIHKRDDEADVEICAKAVDDSAGRRNSKRMSFPLRLGDRLDFQLVQTPGPSADFDVESDVKGFFWEDEPDSVEFAVRVSAECKADAFLGKVKIAANGEPQGAVSFRTAVGGAPDPACAECSFSREHRAARLARSRRIFLERLERVKAAIEEAGAPDAAMLREKDVCEKCLAMLDAGTERSGGILRVFISSTSDMAPYRRAVKEQVEQCGMFPDMYENWGQGNDYPRDMCCRHVLDSDIFICLLGENYGYVEPLWDWSMTELEFRIADQAGKPILVFIHSDFEKGRRGAPRQAELIDELRLRRMVCFFPNEARLATGAAHGLLKYKRCLLDGLPE